MGPPMNADSTKSQFHPLPFYKTNPFRSGSGKPLYNTNPFRQFVDSRFTKRTRVPFCGCGYGAAVNADSGKKPIPPAALLQNEPSQSGLGKPLYNTNPFRQFVDSRFTIRTRVPFCGCGYGAAVNADSGKSRFLPLPFYKTNRPRAARESGFTIRTHSDGFVDSRLTKRTRGRVCGCGYGAADEH